MSPETIGPVNTTGAVTIDNGGQVFSGRLEIVQDRIDITSATATKPDPSWELIDTAGHFHAYATDGELPTLNERTRHVECDHDHAVVFDDLDEDDELDCEGYDVTEWFCRICDEQVKPDRLPDHGPKSIPGMTSWTVTVVGSEPITGAVSVRFAINGSTYFGVAHANLFRAESDGNGVRFIHYLHGSGPLGKR